MPNKNINYDYPINRKEEALKVIDKYLNKEASNEYINNLKLMINDQINAKKCPSFIAQTLFDFINYDIGCHDIEISNDALMDFKHELTNVLEGKKQ